MTLKRSLLIAAALLALPANVALAQGKRAPAKAPPPPAEPPPPPVFPCRTEAEVCYLAVVMGNQVSIVFSNSPEAQGAEPKPIDVMGPDGAKMDMSKNNGLVVMLTGTYDPKVGLTKAAVVEVAGPLQSLVVKAQLGGGGEEPPPGPAPRGGKRR